MDSSTGPGRQALPALHTLIKPDVITTLQYFPEESKEQYRKGVAKLWIEIENNPEGSQEYRNAYDKLVQVSINIQTKIRKAKGDAANAAMSAGQQNGGRPMSSGQPGARPATQGGIQPPAQDYSNKVIEEVRKLKIIPPVAVVNQGPEKMRAWIHDAQNKYASHLQRLEHASNQIRDLEHTISQRQAQGRPLNQQEQEQIRLRREGIEQRQRDTKEFLSRFQQQQDALRAQQAQAQAGNGQQTGPNTTQAPTASTHTQEHKTGMNTQPQIKPEPPNPPHTLSSAVDAARNVGNEAKRSAMSPQNAGQPSQLPQNQQPVSRPQSSQNPIPPSHPHLNVNTNTRPPDQQRNSPHVAPTQPTTMPQDNPIALSHQAAMEQARSSYSHPNIHQPTPQSATHGHPTDTKSQQNQAKMPIPKELHVTPLQAVPMGPSRPTLTNGPGPIGPIGQPAYPRHPGYVLEGEGERVLSKKKLEELVRQVTGGTGVEGDEGEALTAEVEEVSLAYHYLGPLIAFSNLNLRHFLKSPMSSSTKWSLQPASLPNYANPPPWKSATFKSSSSETTTSGFLATLLMSSARSGRLFPLRGGRRN